MPDTTCPDCRTHHASTAARCPECGRVTSAGARESRGVNGGRVLLVAILVGAVLLIAADAGIL